MQTMVDSRCLVGTIEVEEARELCEENVAPGPFDFLFDNEPLVIVAEPRRAEQPLWQLASQEEAEFPWDIANEEWASCPYCSALHHRITSKRYAVLVHFHCNDRMGCVVSGKLRLEKHLNPLRTWGSIYLCETPEADYRKLRDRANKGEADWLAVISDDDTVLFASSEPITEGQEPTEQREALWLVADAVRCQARDKRIRKPHRKTQAGDENQQAEAEDQLGSNADSHNGGGGEAGSPDSEDPNEAEDEMDDSDEGDDWRGSGGGRDENHRQDDDADREPDQGSDDQAAKPDEEPLPVPARELEFMVTMEQAHIGLELWKRAGIEYRKFGPNYGSDGPLTNQQILALASEIKKLRAELPSG